MGHPGLDPQTALGLIQTLLYCLACMLGGSLVLGLLAYVVFLCSEIASSQPTSKARLAKLPHLAARALVAEENLDLFATEEAILAAAEALGGEKVPAPALPNEAQTCMASGKDQLVERTEEAEFESPNCALSGASPRRTAFSQEQ